MSVLCLAGHCRGLNASMEKIGMAAGTRNRLFFLDRKADKIENYFFRSRTLPLVILWQKRNTVFFKYIVASPDLSGIHQKQPDIFR